MKDFTKLHDTLASCAMMLDDAAGQIRETGLESGKNYIRAIGEALERIALIRHAIYGIQPALRPLAPMQSEQEVQANTALNKTMRQVRKLVSDQDTLEAILLLTQHAYRESLPHFKEIALAEREKLEQGTRIA